tara:strand:- start:200 stop:2569 length:2370 start_codon:yes stop_codon:yes gene_type:complete
MSVLDDYLNKRKGSAFDLGKSLLRKQKRSFKGAGALRAITLIKKLADFNLTKDAVKETEEFERKALPIRASLLANFREKTGLVARDKTLKTQWGDDLDGYFIDLANKRWLSETRSSQAPNRLDDSKAFAEYDSYINKQSNLERQRYNAKLTGASDIGKLTEEEATAEIDRIINATISKNLSPENLNSLSVLMRKAKGDNNNTSLQLDAILNKIKELDKNSELNYAPIQTKNFQAVYNPQRKYNDTTILNSVTTLLEKINPEKYDSFDISVIDQIKKNVISKQPNIREEDLINRIVNQYDSSSNDNLIGFRFKLKEKEKSILSAWDSSENNLERYLSKFDNKNHSIEFENLIEVLNNNNRQFAATNLNNNYGEVYSRGQTTVSEAEMTSGNQIFNGYINSSSSISKGYDQIALSEMGEDGDAKNYLLRKILQTQKTLQREDTSLTKLNEVDMFEMAADIYFTRQSEGRNYIPSKVDIYKHRLLKAAEFGGEREFENIKKELYADVAEINRSTNNNALQQEIKEFVNLLIIGDADEAALRNSLKAEGLNIEPLESFASKSKKEQASMEFLTDVGIRKNVDDRKRGDDQEFKEQQIVSHLEDVYSVTPNILSFPFMDGPLTKDKTFITNSPEFYEIGKEIENFKRGVVKVEGGVSDFSDLLLMGEVSEEGRRTRTYYKDRESIPNTWLTLLPGISEIPEGESLEEALSSEQYDALMSKTFGRAIKVVDFWKSKGIDVTKKKRGGIYSINNVEELPKIMKWFADNPTELEALKNLNYDFLKYAEIQSTYLINK